MTFMRATVILLVVVVATSLSAGVKYNFVTTIETSRATETVTGKVWVEGRSYRAEVTRADGSRHGVVSRDADRTATLINLQKNTTAPRVRSGDFRSSSLFAFPVKGAEVKGYPLVTYRRGGRMIIAGQRAVEHVIEAKFNVTAQHGIGGEYTVVARIWAAEQLPPLPMNSAIRTGYRPVDSLLDEAVAKITGMTLRHELEIARTLDGGPASSEKTTTRVTRLERAQVGEEAFVTP